MFPFKSESFTISLHYCLCFCVISYLLLLGDLIAQIKVDKVNTILNSTFRPTFVHCYRLLILSPLKRKLTQTG